MSPIDLFWYAGLEITHKLPPLTYVPLVMIQLIVGNLMLASRIFYLVLVGLMALSVYWSIRLRSGRFLGLVAGFIVAFSLSSIGGPEFNVLVSFTRYFAFILFPPALYCAVMLTKKSFGYAFALSFFLALMILSHPMVALISMFWIAVYAGVLCSAKGRSRP